MSLFKLIDLLRIGDELGSLVAIEANQDIPFDVKRVYYMLNVQAGCARGFHAHRKLKQLAVCVSGSCRILLDDGKNKESVVLDSPAKGLLIGDLVWREMHDFTSDCVLLVLASGHYDESDYIHDYNDFIREVRA